MSVILFNDKKFDKIRKTKEQNREAHKAAIAQKDLLATEKDIDKLQEELLNPEKLNITLLHRLKDEKSLIETLTVNSPYHHAAQEPILDIKNVVDSHLWKLEKDNVDEIISCLKEYVKRLEHIYKNMPIVPVSRAKNLVKKHLQWAYSLLEHFNAVKKHKDT